MPEFSAQDEVFMRRAVELAWKSAGKTRPNPPVGAVVAKGGRVIGEGRHKRAGGPHAEAAALAACKQSPRGATVYVTLEPCSTPGRVGACTDALAAAGVARVVWACRDPNPANAGRAARILRRAGIECAHGLCRAEAEPLVAPFAKHVLTGMPFVTVKLAMSLDGRVCDGAGAAKWISGPAARKATGRLRSTVDAVMAGAGTVRADDPSLLCREGRNDSLLRVIVCSGRGLPPDSQVLTDGAADRTIVAVPADGGDRVDLRTLMRALGARGVMHVLCEGGLKLARALADEGLVDEWISVQAPVLIGSRPLAAAPRGRLVSVRTAGCDTIARFAFGAAAEEIRRPQCSRA